MGNTILKKNITYVNQQCIFFYYKFLKQKNNVTGSKKKCYILTKNIFTKNVMNLLTPNKI